MREDLADLERRVLAHEQILQAVIGHLAVAEPQFLERLSATFRHPVHLSLDGCKEGGTAAYAAMFVRESVRQAETRRDAASVLVSRWDDLWPTSGEDNLRVENVPVRFEIVEKEDMWEVLCDGRLAGGYVSRPGAFQAAQDAVQEIFAAGGSAELLTGRPVTP